MKCSWSSTFPIFDLSIHSGDICDQIRKLLKIALNFYVSYPPKFCRGTTCKISVHVMTPPISGPIAFWFVDQSSPEKSLCLPLVKFREVTPTTSKVIGAHMWNFKPNFKCSPLKFFWGTPIRFVVCASKPWLESSACKNFRGQHPLRAEI